MSDHAVYLEPLESRTFLSAGVVQPMAPCAAPPAGPATVLPLAQPPRIQARPPATSYNLQVLLNNRPLTSGAPVDFGAIADGFSEKLTLINHGASPVTLTRIQLPVSSLPGLAFFKLYNGAETHAYAQPGPDGSVTFTRPLVLKPGRSAQFRLKSAVVGPITGNFAVIGGNGAPIFGAASQGTVTLNILAAVNGQGVRDGASIDFGQIAQGSRPVPRTIKLTSPQPVATLVILPRRIPGFIVSGFQGAKGSRQLLFPKDHVDTFTVKVDTRRPGLWKRDLVITLLRKPDRVLFTLHLLANIQPRPR